jgi:hypothetical protein
VIADAVRLARDYGTFMLRNALALAVVLEVEGIRLRQGFLRRPMGFLLRTACYGGQDGGQDGVGVPWGGDSRAKLATQKAWAPRSPRGHSCTKGILWICTALQLVTWSINRLIGDHIRP